MGHKHHWRSYPPEGEVRRSKTWDELEWDEEEMVTNARVLEDIEDLRLKVSKDQGFRESTSWPTLTEWCSSCIEMRVVKFTMPDDNMVEKVKASYKKVNVDKGIVKDVKEKKEQVEEKPVNESEKHPDPMAEVQSSEPGANR